MQCFKNQNQCKKFTVNKISKFEVRTGSVIVPYRAVLNLDAVIKIRKPCFYLKVRYFVKAYIQYKL